MFPLHTGLEDQLSDQTDESSHLCATRHGASGALIGSSRDGLSLGLGLTGLPILCDRFGHTIFDLEPLVVKHFLILNNMILLEM
jgi:hypothetical protein